MASSRKSQQSPNLGKRIAVALSGGLDSVVLLDAVCKAQAKNKNEIFAFHIHHGLQKQADDWLIFCEQLAKKYKIHFDFRLLHLDAEEAKGNIEARARAGRYEALADLCDEYGIEDLLLAHHQNDQAETVLLQLLRGSGVAGLSGMPHSRQLQVNDHRITLWRPLLNQNRQDLEAYAKERKLQWIEDPSNQDESYRRNAIRKILLPQLEKVQPGAIPNLARSARHLAEAQDLLNQLADIDLGLIDLQAGLSKTNLMRLYKTSQSRAKNALRRWLGKQGLVHPSEDRLVSWFTELQQVRVDACLHWEHDGVLIRLWRGHLSVEQSKRDPNKKPKSQQKNELDNQSGEWVFKNLAANSKKIGIAKDRFNEAKAKGLINTMERQGGEKFKVQINRPRKSLKNLYQEASIPPWQRDVPLLYIGDELVAVAGIGISADWQSVEGPRIGLEWLSS